MKIGLFIENISLSTGGVYTFYEKLLYDLKSLETEHEFIIFHRTEKPRLSKDFWNRFTLVEIRNLTLFDRICRKLLQKLNHIRFLFDLPSPLDKALNKHQVDLMIYPPGIQPSEKFPFIMLVWDVGHRIFPYLPEERLHHAYVEHILIPFLPRAFRIIIGNETGKRQLLQFYPIQPESIRTIPLPVFDFPATDAAEELPIDFPLPERPFVFYPAQFWPHKNHITLIRAIQILKTRDQLKIDVVLTGSDKGNRANVTRQIAEHGLEDQFHLPGLVSSAAIRLLYTKALALTYLSILGPDNMPPLEAMNLKCPVICAKYAGAEEQLGDAALFFEQFDAEQLADHISTLYQNPELKNTMIRKGAARAEQRKFNYAEKLVQVAEEFTPYLSFWK